jgi:outer membrane biosynthesis protein TonB
VTKSPGLACGQVFVRFVIDAGGRVDLKTVEVLKTDDPRFVPEVLKMIPNMRFSAAEIGGRKVRELVQIPFLFGPVGCVPAPPIPAGPPAPRAVTS